MCVDVAPEEGFDLGFPLMGRERGSAGLGRAVLAGPGVVAREAQLRVGDEHGKRRVVATLVELPDVAADQHPNRRLVHGGVLLR
jgi:hypothetical protein